MSYAQFDSPQPASRDTSPDISFFYNNQNFEEVRGSLRYGVEARKGLILLTGDAGTGKTMLLHRVIQELDNGVTFIVESDPDVNFTALLRLMLRNLNHESDSADRVSMLQSCKRILRAELERGHTICLILDNAERVRDDTLECVMQNFLGPAASRDRDQKILQVILAGRPPLQERLLQPGLRSITPSPGLVCHVEALSHQDAADYVRHRIQAGQLAGQSIRNDAIDRIVAYAAGNLRSANLLCGYVLELAQKSSIPKITAELIDAAARDLDIAKSPPVENKTPKANFEIPNDRDEPFSFQLGDGDSTQVVGQTFLNYHDNEPRPWLRHGDRDRTAVRLFLTVIFLGAAFLWLQDQFGGFPPADWNEKLRDLTGASEQLSTQPKTGSPVPLQTAQIEPSSPPAPAKDDSPPQVVEQTLVNPSRLEADRSNEPDTVRLPEKPEKPARQALATKAKTVTKNTSLPASNERRASTSENPEILNKQLEMEIYKAIENRAIIGIAVSVDNGTAYLEGQVATERQKRAAESAARSVGGVERVRSRIGVS